MAAVLAVGWGAMLSHRAAGSLWGLCQSSWIEVTAPTRRVRPGIRAHRARVPSDETRVERGIPVTDVGRTLLDLASVLRPHQLERAMNEAEIRRLDSALSLTDLMARYSRRCGVAAIKTALAKLEEGAPNQNDFEALFVAFARDRGLPEPDANVLVEGRQCDCVWRRQGVIVELDSRAFHGTDQAFEHDRVRDRALAAAGWRTVRVTWRQLRIEPEALAADLRRILGLDFVTPG